MGSVAESSCLSQNMHIHIRLCQGLCPAVVERIFERRYRNTFVLVEAGLLSKTQDGGHRWCRISREALDRACRSIRGLLIAYVSDRFSAPPASSEEIAWTSLIAAVILLFLLWAWWFNRHRVSREAL